MEKNSKCLIKIVLLSTNEYSGTIFCCFSIYWARVSSYSEADEFEGTAGQ